MNTVFVAFLNVSGTWQQDHWKISKTMLHYCCRTGECAQFVHTHQFYNNGVTLSYWFSNGFGARNIEKCNKKRIHAK
jgi:hypothetical protein